MSSDEEDSFDPNVVWIWDPATHKKVPAHKLDKADVDIEKEEHTLVTMLFDKARAQGKKPCLICCIKKGANNRAVWAADCFYSLERMADHVSTCHHKLLNKGAKCPSCGNVFRTSALRDIHQENLRAYH